MLVNVLVVVAVVAVGLLVARLARRPTPLPVPTTFEAPEWLERADFASPEAPWLVAVFTSATCHTCAEVWSKASVLASDAVAVQDVEVGEVPELHRRYGIAGVPITAVADHDGRVRASFVGPVSATHLWAALAELRAPGSLPGGCDPSRSPTGSQAGGQAASAVRPGCHPGPASESNPRALISLVGAQPKVGSRHLRRRSVGVRERAC